MDNQLLTALGITADESSLSDDLRSFADGEDMSPDLAAIIQQVGGRGLRELFSYCLTNDGKPRPLDEEGLQIATRRFVAVTWLLHSEMLVGEDGKPMTLKELGALPQVGCTRCAMSLYAQRFARQFNFQSRVQKRAGSKQNYAASAKTGWAKRRERERRPKATSSPRSPSPRPKSRPSHPKTGPCRRCKDRDAAHGTYVCDPCRTEIDAKHTQTARLLAQGKKQCSRCGAVKEAADFVEGGLRCHVCRLAVNAACRAKTKARGPLENEKGEPDFSRLAPRLNQPTNPAR